MSVWQSPKFSGLCPDPCDVPLVQLVVHYLPRPPWTPRSTIVILTMMRNVANIEIIVYTLRESV